MQFLKLRSQGMRSSQYPSLQWPLRLPLRLVAEEVNLIKVKTMINVNKKYKKGEVAHTKEQINEANYLRLCTLTGRGVCVNKRGSKALKCNCLQVLEIEVY